MAGSENSMRDTASAAQNSDERDGARQEGDEALDPRFLECLVCPLTHGPLRYDRAAGELVSDKARLAFPIRSGVPILLESEGRALKDGEV